MAAPNKLDGNKTIKTKTVALTHCAIEYTLKFLIDVVFQIRVELVDFWGNNKCSLLNECKFPFSAKSEFRLVTGKMMHNCLNKGE